MNIMYFDIETLPAEKEKHPILIEIHQKRIDDGKQVKELDVFLAETTFDGAFGRIACISYAINDNPVQTLCGSEEEMLKEFWTIAKTVDLFVGFNIIDFDMRFIYQRSIIKRVRPTRDLTFARYRNNPMYDLMHEWSKWGGFNNRINLDGLAKALGLPSSKGGEIEGKDVAKAWEDGKVKEICDYCEKDVEVTRKIYKKMSFTEHPAF